MEDAGGADEGDELGVFEGGHGRGRADLEGVEDLGEAERFALLLAGHLLVVVEHCHATHNPTCCDLD